MTCPCLLTPQAETELRRNTLKEATRRGKDYGS